MNSLSCVILFVLAAMAMGEKPQYDVSNAEALFKDFVVKYNKEYKDEADRQVHYEAFVKTLQIINKANKESDSATYDINSFADYTPEQKKHLTGLLQPKN